MQADFWIDQHLLGRRDPVGQHGGVRRHVALDDAERDRTELVVAGRRPDELKDSKRTRMQVHGRTGEPCPVCGDTVREVVFADSTFQYCPTCQTGGKPLADRVLSRLLK